MDIYNYIEIFLILLGGIVMLWMVYSYNYIFFTGIVHLSKSKNIALYKFFGGVEALTLLAVAINKNTLEVSTLGISVGFVLWITLLCLQHRSLSSEEFNPIGSPAFILKILFWRLSSFLITIAITLLIISSLKSSNIFENSGFIKSYSEQQYITENNDKDLSFIKENIFDIEENYVIVSSSNWEELESDLNVEPNIYIDKPDLSGLRNKNSEAVQTFVNLVREKGISDYLIENRKITTKDITPIGKDILYTLSIGAGCVSCHTQYLDIYTDAYIYSTEVNSGYVYVNALGDIYKIEQLYNEAPATFGQPANTIVVTKYSNNTNSKQLYETMLKKIHNVQSNQQTSILYNDVK